MVIGGAEIYRQAFPKAELLYLTQVHADVEGDAYFEGFSVDDWALVTQQDHKAAANNPYDYSFCKYQRNA